MQLLHWLIPVANAATAAPHRRVNVCLSFFNFLHLPCAGPGVDPTESSVAGLLARIITFLLSISATLCVVFIVYAGVLLIISAFDPEQRGKATKIMIGSTIGLTVTMTAFVVTSGVRAAAYYITFGVVA